jgi:hydrogenase maturation protease
MNVLVYGYGNPGRQDDGVGVLCVSELEAWAREARLDYVRFDSNYQLNPEDALTVSEHDATIFLDAAAQQRDPFEFTKVIPGDVISFSSHAMTPRSLLALCKELYQLEPRAWALTIKARSWNINQEPTVEAMNHLAQALMFVKPLLADPQKFALYDANTKH